MKTNIKWFWGAVAAVVVLTAVFVFGQSSQWRGAFVKPGTGDQVSPYEPLRPGGGGRILCPGGVNQGLFTVSLNPKTITLGTQKATICYVANKNLSKGFTLRIDGTAGIVKTLYSTSQNVASGTKGTFAWDGTDNNGRQVAPGDYLYKFVVQGIISAQGIIKVLAPPPLPVTAASLTVFRSSTPVSQNYIVGQLNANLLGLDLKTGSSSDVIVKKITVRLVADDDGIFDNNGYGDTAANTVLNTVKLYALDQNGVETVIGGPAGLSLVGAIGQPGGYYKAEFFDQVRIPKFSSVKWLVKVDLRNTIFTTRYFAADVFPSIDIEAVDQNGTKVNVMPGAGGVNNVGNGNPSVIMTVGVLVISNGTLSAKQEGSPDATIVVAGTTGVPFAKYKFSAMYEGFTVRKLEVVGTTSGAVSYLTSLSATGAGVDNNISRVGLSYKKKDGTNETMYIPIVGGKATFSNLNFYVPQNGSADITILADLNTIEFGAISGSAFLLGLNQGYLEAVGAGSAVIINANQLGPIANTSAINLMTLRKTVPTVAKLATAARKLVNGQNDIAAITIHADAKEAVALKRILFRSWSSGGLDVNNLELYRKVGNGSEINITSQVSIRSETMDRDLKIGGVNLFSTNGSTSDIISVAWNNNPTDQEFVSRGVTNTYSLRVTVSNASPNDSISTYIADDTARLPPMNAQQVIDTFANFVWSDNSAVSHTTFTTDWTNGLDVPNLPTQTLTLTF